MTQDLKAPVADSVMSKLAELTLQLEGSQRDTLATLVYAGLGGSDDVVVDGEASGGAPSEADVAVVAARLHALRETMTQEEQQLLDNIVATAMQAPEPEVAGNTWYTITSIVAPRGLNFMYSGYCKQFSAAYGGRWASTTLTQYTAHSWSTMSTYTCWGWR